MALFSIWEGDICGVILKQGYGPPKNLDRDRASGELLDIHLVKQFVAGSWSEACQIRKDLYRLGLPVLEDDWEEFASDEA